MAIIIIIIIIKIVHEVLWPACEAIPESTRATDLIRSSSSSDGITGESACSVQQLVSQRVSRRSDWMRQCDSESAGCVDEESRTANEDGRRADAAN